MELEFEETIQSWCTTKLDTKDVVLCGMTCTALRESTEDHHVWLDQLQNCSMRNPVLARVIPPLHSLSTEELKRHAIHQEKLRTRWRRDRRLPEPFVCGPGWFDGRGSMWLMAGGAVALFMSELGKISLHRIRAPGEHLEVTPFASRTLEGGYRWVLMTLISDNESPPLLACKEESHCSLQLVSIDSERGIIRPEAVVQIPKEKALVRLARHERTVVCMLSPGGGAWSLMIVHLDCPYTTIEAKLPNSPHASFVCLPRRDVVVIYNQFDITCFRLMDPTTFGEGNHVLTLVALWTQSNPLAGGSLIYHVSLTERADTSQSTSPTFEARFVEYGQNASTDRFVSWKIGPLCSFAAPAMLENLPKTISLPGGPRSFPASTRDHCFWSAVAVDNGISFFVTPLDDVGREDGWGTLRFDVPNAEFGEGSAGARAVCLDLDIDRASGRVIIWWVDEECPEDNIRTRFVVLELVRDSHSLT